MGYSPVHFLPFFMLRFHQQHIFLIVPALVGPGVVLNVRAEGEVGASQQTRFEPVYVRHCCQVQGILSS